MEMREIKYIQKEPQKKELTKRKRQEFIFVDKKVNKAQEENPKNKMEQEK